MITSRSRTGPLPCFIRRVGLTVALALSPVVAAAQDRPATPADGPASAAADESATEQRAPGAEPSRPPERLRFRWRNASLQYGTRTRIDFRTRMRAETRASDAGITQDTLNDLDIPRKRVGVDGQIMGAFGFKVDRELDAVRPWRDAYIDVTKLAEAQFRYGQFKMPFSIDETTGSLD